MHVHHTRGLTALFLSLWLPVTAFAQDIPFEVLAQSEYGGRTTAGTVIAGDAAVAREQGLTDLLPSGTQIDWDQHVLVAVFTGQRQAGSHTIVIDRIERAGLGESTSLVVHFRELSTPSFTPAQKQPYLLARVARSDITPVAVASPFGQVHRTESSGSVQVRVKIEDDGQVEISRVDPVLHSQPFTGMATAEELRALREAVQRARLDTLPADLSAQHQEPQDPFSLPQGVSRVTYEVFGGAQHGARASGMIGALEPAYAQRLAPVDAAIEAIRDRLQPTGVFTELHRTEEINDVANGWIHVSNTGEVRILDYAVSSRPFTGQATDAELRELRAAVQAARLDTLPADVSEDQPTPQTSLTTTYRVFGGAQHGARAKGWTGLFHPDFAQRLEPVDAALDAMRDRLSQPFVVLRREEVVNGGGTIARIAIEAGGDVEVLDLTVSNQPFTGQATPEELAVLRAAVLAARLDTLPAALSENEPVPVIPLTVTYTVTGGAQGGARTSGWKGVLSPDYAARLESVDAALDAIRDRLQAAPQPGTTPLGGSGMSDALDDLPE